MQATLVVEVEDLEGADKEVEVELAGPQGALLPPRAIHCLQFILPYCQPL